jgi:hypothetical protein
MSADITVLAAANDVHHAAGPLESKLDVQFGREMRMWRQGCTCGHLGMWTNGIGYALEAYARHFNRATR